MTLYEEGEWEVYKSFKGFICIRHKHFHTGRSSQQVYRGKIQNCRARSCKALIPEKILLRAKFELVKNKVTI